MTDRRTAASETELLAAVIASVSDAVVTTDENAGITYMNAAAEALYGVRCEDVCGQSTIRTFLAEHEQERGRDLARRLYEGETLAPDLQLRMRRADGTEFDGELNAFLVRDPDGSVLGLAALVRDVTARVAAEAESQTLRAVVESASEGIICLDDEGTIHFFSPAAERIYGYRAEEIIGAPVSALVAEHRQQFLEAFKARVRAGESVRRVTVARRKDGSHVDVMVSAGPMRGPGGAVQGFVITVLDISERRSTQRLLDLVIEHAPMVVAVKDQHGRYRMFNRIGAESLGLDQHAVVGSTDEELFGPELALRFSTGDREVMERGEPMTYQEDVEVPIGTRHFVTTKFPLRDAAGVVDGIGILAADVTEIRQAESDRARLAALVQSAPDAIIAQDRDGRIATWNPGAEVMFGLSAEEAIGRDGAELIVPPWERERFWSDFAEVRNGRTLTKRCTRLRADGSVFPVRVSAAPVRMLDGAWSGTLSMVRDITDLVAAEAELEARAAQLERSNADLERFAYAASHDLQEPLQSIKLSAGAVIDAAAERLDADERELLTHIDTAASRLSGQIRGLLQVARVALGEAPEERVAVEVAVQDALDALRAAAHNAGARIDVQQPLPDALVPRAELALVLQNLIANAIKYAREGEQPRISVTGMVGDDALELRVVDDGIGLSDADRARVFDLFERAQPDLPGTGLGLATAQRIVERHGGTITASSPGPGQGSEFTVWLPLRP